MGSVSAQATEAVAESGRLPLLLVLTLTLPAWLAACGILPHGRAVAPQPAPEPTAPASAPAAPGDTIPAHVRESFARGLSLMREGNATQAELAFRQITLEEPQLAAPYVNLAILYRKENRFEDAEKVLKGAVEHIPASALVWTELGATQRLRGEFPDAAGSYEKAIAADPGFAPAYRNLGVVSDLYLGDPVRALAAFERYQKLTGEDKPVSNWIAELRQRTGKTPAKPGAPASAPAEPQKAADPATAPPKAGA